MANIETMIELARETMDRAYAPYSNYHVGVCAEAEDGSLFAGCNVENALYGIGVCAEVTAICSLIAAGKKRIKSLLVMGQGSELCTPCGRCRQFMREFATLDTPIHLADTSRVHKTVTLQQLLPMSWGRDHLAKKDIKKSAKKKYQRK